MQRTFLLGLGVLCGIVFGPSIWAQTSEAQITGLITDASGAVLPGASITVTNEATGIRRMTAANEAGLYVVPLLPPGNYGLTVKKEGFRIAEHRGITLQVSQTARLDFVLEVGAVSDSVQVTSNVSRVETQSSTLKQVVDEMRMRELPLNGRDTNQLIFLLPGVYSTNDTSGLQQGGSARGIVQPGVASNGARGNMVSYSLDGAFHNDTYTNVSLPMPNPDALQEFSVQTNNFSSEFGRSAGAVVSAVTRSGTNAIHGNLFEFVRNNALNAWNFFATSDDGLKRNQFGGSLGGPVWIPKLYNGRDHTFFFVSYQETRQVQRPSTSNTTVLTAAQRVGDFSAYGSPIIDPLTNQPFPGKQIPLSRMDPLTGAIIDKILPLPTEPSTGLLWYTVPNNSNFRQLITKVDHHIGSKDTLSGRYFYNYYESPANDSSLVFATKPLTYTPSHNVGLNETHIFSPTLINQAIFSANLRTSENAPVWKTGMADLGMKNVFSNRPTPEFILSVSGAFSVE
ncbi:MAG TPA: carboxypeptidase regulatory-like domain-containing protein, partial [Bryobacteraceae bacterium]|nr:carboxypeptidase regulatory-like domain-containing protein [Bryobacteraceae bacterium]